MGIVLSNHEKKSFFSFLALYLGSSFLLIIMIAFLYFNKISNSIIESQRDKMRTHATNIAAKAISTHMYKKPFLYKNDSKYKIGMYSSRYNLLYGEEIKNIDFTKNNYKTDNALYIIDQSAHLHHGIKYIVLKNTELFNELYSLKKQIITYTIFTLMLVGLIGFILGRLFLKPIANEREKLDKFIKDSTHELNTPISALLMSISSLKNEESKIKERIRLSAIRISSIYDDLCYLLKDELKEEKEIIQIDLKKIIEEQLFLLETYAKSKKININTQLQNTLLYIDQESAKRLINNLLTNALKYSKPNTTIKIFLNNNSLEIIDEGIGINQKDLKYIKNRYYRANQNEGGFGIGLDIVNTICKKYNIDFNIDSKKDMGSVVNLKFR